MNLQYAIKLIRELVNETTDPNKMPRLTPLQFDALRELLETCENEF